MKFKIKQPLRNLFSRRHLLIAVCFLSGVIATNKCVQAQIEGFIEPFKNIELASDESGTIFNLYVEEGQAVDQGEVIGTLDNRLQKLQVELSAEQANSKAELEAAERTLNKRSTILDRIQQLNKDGHAGRSELIRAELEHSIALARWKAIQETLVQKDVEFRQAKLQLEKRSIRAPFRGIVSEVYRQEGEFVSPVRPEIVRLVQLDKVYATFAVELSMADAFSVGQQLEVTIGDQVVTGTVDYVSVQADAKSRTVKVKLIIDNSDMQLRTGEICTIQI